MLFQVFLLGACCIPLNHIVANSGALHIRVEFCNFFLLVTTETITCKIYGPRQKMDFWHFSPYCVLMFFVTQFK
jgi:hypothetical protein